MVSWWWLLIAFWLGACVGMLLGSLLLAAVRRSEREHEHVEEHLAEQVVAKELLESGRGEDLKEDAGIVEGLAARRGPNVARRATSLAPDEALLRRFVFPEALGLLERRVDDEMVDAVRHHKILSRPESSRRPQAVHGRSCPAGCATVGDEEQYAMAALDRITVDPETTGWAKVALERMLAIT